MKRATRVFVVMAFILNSVAACKIIEGGNRPSKESGSGGYVVKECSGNGAVNSDKVRFVSRSPAQIFQNYPEICGPNP